MMKQLLLAFCLLFSTYSYGQLTTNSVAPDWTLTDINGVEHTLYDYLDEGKVVYIKFSATWCGPCWNYHQGGAFSDMYYDYGPDGTDEVMVFFLEADPNTNTDCLYGPAGCNGNTMGDWVTGTPYPIIDLPDLTVRSAYQVNAFPTVFSICPDTRVVRPWNPGGPPKSVLETAMASCAMSAEVAATGDEFCFGDQQGYIHLDAVPGHGNTNYSWSNGANTQDLDNIPQGTYSLTVTDQNNREIYLDEVVISGPEAELEYEITEVIHNLCAFDASGSINVSTSGGTPGYSFIWSNGESSQSLSGLDGGTYALTITDENDCTVETPVIEIDEPEELFMFVDPADENCDSEDGEIFVFAEGGTGVYFFDIGLGPQSDPYFPNLTAGLYEVILTDDNGCEKSEFVELDNQPPPVADAGEDFDFPCAEPTAQLDGSGSSGAQNLSFQWSTSDGNIVEGEDTPNPTIDQPGSYLLIITNDDNGCTDFALVDVAPDPNSPEVSIAPHEALDCDLVEITLDGSASSSGPNFVYQWTTPNGNIVEGSNSPIALINEPGSYTLLVTHGPSGCVASSTVTVESVAEDIEISASVSNALSCELLSAVLSGEGSAEGDEISYSWINSEGVVVSEEIQFVADQAGEYTFEVLNIDNGCLASVVVIVEDDSDLPEIEVSETSFLTCTESSVTLSGEGSASGDNIIYIWTNVEGSEVLGEEMELIVNSAGTYVFQVINTENGCISEAAVEVEVDDEVPFADAGEELELTCESPRLNLDGSNSDEGDQFSYLWTTEDGEIIEGESTLNPLIGSPGVYTLVVVNNENECEAQSSVVVTEFIDTPVAGFEFNVDNLMIALFDNSQTESYTLEWDFGDGNSSTETNPEHQFSQAGEFTICLTISNACGSDTHCETVEVSGAGISVFAEIIDVSCHGGTDGSVTVEAAGNDPFQFLWENGVEGPVLEGVAAGTYEVEITDNTGFTIIETFVVSEPDAIEVYDVSITDVTSATQGSVIVNIRGGTPPYSFLWSNGATTQNLEDVGLGEYTLTITDGNECVTVVGPFEVEDFSNTIDLEGLVEFNVFPNPFGSSLMVEYLFDVSETTHIVVRDILGRIVYNYSDINTSNEIFIDAGNWASGFYTVELSRESGFAIKKLLKN
ncbi:MAG: PKD domain-containing protein [Saprospirales bacterium]|nr:MAG: PKD domain-containing protein [Saprospirales bacterium]